MTVSQRSVLVSRGSAAPLAPPQLLPQPTLPEEGETTRGMIDDTASTVDNR